MKGSIAIVLAGLSAMASTFPTPTDKKIDYSDLDYSHVDWDKVGYSKVDFKDLDYSHVDWSKVDWTKVPYPHSALGSEHVPEKEPSCMPEHKPDISKDGETIWKYSDFLFTSVYHVIATPDQVVNSSNQFTGGLKDTQGTYDIGINSKLDLICYFIELYNFRGEYQSPAKSATHIHQADRGKSGPPRIAFPNPQPVNGYPAVQRSAGCMTGPFVTGVLDAHGSDTGSGFRVEQIEKNPHNFFADVHSSLAVPGAVRGQIV